MTPTLERAYIALRAGQCVIVQDALDRENEGDLICHAATCTTASINFMSKFGRGLICLALPSEHVEQLDLPLQPVRGQAAFHSNFTVSIDAATNITTGISCQERAHTIRIAAQSNCPPSALVTPGHVFPLKAHPDGLAARKGHTEASLALMTLAQLSSNAVICEVLDDAGQSARTPTLQALSEQHDLPLITIQDIWIALQTVS